MDRRPPENAALDVEVEKMLRAMPDVTKWTEGMCKNWCLEHMYPYTYAEFLFDKIMKQRNIAKGLYDPEEDG